MDVHRGLREASATLGICVVDSAETGAINQPGDTFLGPLDGVGVESVLRIADGDPGLTIISRGVAFSEVVGLNGVSLSAQCFLYFG